MAVAVAGRRRAARLPPRARARVLVPARRGRAQRRRSTGSRRAGRQGRRRRTRPSCTAASTHADCPGGATLTGQLHGRRLHAGHVRGRSRSATTRRREHELLHRVADRRVSTTYKTPTTTTSCGSAPRRTSPAASASWSRSSRPRTSTLNFPNATLVAGKFEVSNNGNKVMIDTNGVNNEWTPGDIIVRCALSRRRTAPSGTRARARSSRPRSAATRTSPRRSAPRRSTSSAPARRPRATTTPAARRRSRASTGPASMVFMENAEGCHFNGNQVYNSPTKPGYVVIANGTPTLNGNATFYGVIYHANESESNAMLINMKGNISIFGSIVIDGAGGLSAGSSKVNLVYNPNAFSRAPGLRHRRPRAEHVPRDRRAPSLKTPAARADSTSMLKNRRRQEKTIVGLELDPSHLAAAEVTVNGSHHRHARRGRRRCGPASCATARSPTRPRSPRRCRRSSPSTTCPSSVRLGIANQRIVVRTLDLPPLEDPKALAAAVRAEAPDHIPMPMDEAILDFQPLGDVDDARRPAHARRHRRRPPRDDRPARRRRRARPASTSRASTSPPSAWSARSRARHRRRRALRQRRRPHQRRRRQRHRLPVHARRRRRPRRDGPARSPSAAASRTEHARAVAPARRPRRRRSTRSRATPSSSPPSRQRSRRACTSSPTPSATR